MERPFFTVGIASYNYAALLPRAFAQLKKQAFRDFEVLYCDDGSTDDSCSVIERFIVDNPDMSVRLVRGENGGILANKNRILDNARGQYLMICDADDYMADDCLARLHDALARTGADCVIGAFDEVDPEGAVIKRHPLPAAPVRWLYTQHHAQAYRLDIPRRFGIRFEALPDDLCYLHQVHLHCGSTVYVHEPVYFWYRHDDSVSRNTAVHADWKATALWRQIAAQTGRVLGEAASGADRAALRYFLLKYYFINALDMPPGRLRDIRRALSAMRADLRAVWADYAAPAAWRSVRAVPDTGHARRMVRACLLLERAGLLPLAVWLRARTK